MLQNAVDDETKTTIRSSTTAVAEPVVPMVVDDEDMIPDESREETAWYQTLRDN